MARFAGGLTALLLLAAFCQTTVGQFNQCTGGDICVNIRECGMFGPHFNTPSRWSDNLKTEFRARICKRETRSGVNVFKVCCPGNTGGQDDRKRGLAVLDLDNCGRYTDEKIAFGNDAKLMQFPWMALLKPRVGNFSCGGTLINERYVLTAAHCLKDANIVYVRLGEYDLSKAIDCDKRGELCAVEPQDIPVERIILHENYSPRYRVNDIGLIRLAHKATLNDNVHPICLPVSPQLRTKQNNYVVAGWGQTHKADYSNKLQFTKLKLMQKNECQQRLQQKDPYVKIVDSQMCAIGSNLSDNCSGDSGGPLKTVSINARYVQYGVVSFGLRSCGKYSAPGVYTKVEHYKDWILDKLVE